MKVEIWNDLVCPWCYLGKRRFERALQSFEHRARVQLEWRSYQLDPSAPAEFDGTVEEWLASRRVMSAEQARSAHARLQSLGAAEGVIYDFARARIGNTATAHRLVHLSRTSGKADAMIERLMVGYFEDGLSIGNRAALTGVAAEVGLDAAEVEALLDGDRFAAEVRADQDAARARGFGGVPAFLFAGSLVVSGAQSTATFAEALQRAWAASS